MVTVQDLATRFAAAVIPPPVGAVLPDTSTVPLSTPLASKAISVLFTAVADIPQPEALTATHAGSAAGREVRLVQVATLMDTHTGSAGKEVRLVQP